ncbi:MAG: DUF429 domain-containing protein [Akkermansiaceae bacterium]|nr:DUF429 domain-containing protein [Armatimonadota bacterium]
MTFQTIYGVDFSGARFAGKNTWIARLEPPSIYAKNEPLLLASLSSLETLAGTAERAPALAHLVDLIRASEGALWAMDFPFGLPVEVMEPGAGWARQFRFLHAYKHDAYAAGLECVRRARMIGDALHIRRATDTENKAPFDSYHYRIIYQTFHGMWDVLRPLRGDRETAILPFHEYRVPSARRVLVEACPASTLKRMGLPFQNYKEPGGGTLAAKRLRPRWDILDGLTPHVAISKAHRKVIMENGGGDALDAIIAGVGAADAMRRTASKTEMASESLVREGKARYLCEGKQFI